MEGWYSIIFHPTLLDSLLTVMLIAVQNLEWIFASLDVSPPTSLLCTHRERGWILQFRKGYEVTCIFIFSIEIHVSSGEKNILESHYLPLSFRSQRVIAKNLGCSLLTEMWTALQDHGTSLCKVREGNSTFCKTLHDKYFLWRAQKGKENTENKNVTATQHSSCRNQKRTSQKDNVVTTKVC